jgi:hypothetical protein
MASSKNKYEIIGKIPSVIGFSTKSAKEGDLVSIATQLNYYNVNNISDEYILIAHSQIYSTLSQWVFPWILKTFSGKQLPDDFLLYAVYIEMHGDESKNKIVINEDTSFRVTCKIKKGIEFKKDDPVQMNHIEYLTSIEKTDKDPNAATILLMQHNGNWFGKYDLIYNRENVTEKMDRALDFFDSAIVNLRNSNITAFYQSLWDCSELLAESLLLLHNQIKIKSEHKKIRHVFEEFCKLHSLEYFEDYRKITEIRNNSRYGPPHPKNKDAGKESECLLKNSYVFLRYVLSFLKERQIIPSSNQLQKIDVSITPLTNNK